MTRVLFIDHVDRVLGGAEINLIELIEEAQKHNDWQIAVACRSGSLLSQALAKLNVQQFDYGFCSGLNTLRFAGKSFPWMRLTGGLRALNQASSELGKILDQFKPAVAISCTNKDHFASAKACRERGVKSFWWVNDHITPEFFPLPARIAFRKYAARAHTLVAVSESVANAIKFAGPKVQVIYNGIPVQKFTRTERANAFPDSGGVPVFGNVGRYCEWKGQHDLLTIAYDWIRSGNPGSFELVGAAFNEDAVYEKTLRLMVENFAENDSKAKEMIDRVHFVPFQKDIFNVFAGLSALLHTAAKPEPFGRVIVEAMAAGVPVIAPNVGGPAEIIQDGFNGFLADPCDLKSFTAKMKLVWPRTTAVENIITNARSTVAERFTVGRVYRDFANLLARP